MTSTLTSLPSPPGMDAAPRNELIPLSAIAIDGSIDTQQLAEAVGWPELRRFAYGSLFAGPVGRVYVFRFGALVADGVDLATAVETIARHVDCPTVPATQENLFVSIDPQAATGPPRVGWDRVVIAEGSPQILDAVALLLGQSVALERYELDIDRLTREAIALPEPLIRGGRLPRPNRRLWRWTGRLIRYRLELASHFFRFDRPADTWEFPAVAALYDALFANLELPERHRAILDKLEAIEGATDRVTHLWQGRLSNRLEWAIVFLIIIELVFAVITLS